MHCLFLSPAPSVNAGSRRRATQNRTTGLVLLLGIFVLSELGAVAQTTISRPSPKAVMEQFCRMEANGRYLTPEGWRQMVKLLVASTTQARLDEMAVVRDYAVSEPVIDGNKAKVTVEYTTVGILDTRNLSFGPRGPHPIEPEKITIERTLILTDKHAEVGSNGVVNEVVGALEWRIDGQAEPHISVQTAIRYLRQLRMKTTNDAFRKSADESVATLQQLQ